MERGGCGGKGEGEGEGEGGEMEREGERKICCRVQPERQPAHRQLQMLHRFLKQQLVPLPGPLRAHTQSRRVSITSAYVACKHGLRDERANSAACLICGHGFIALLLTY